MAIWSKIGPNCQGYFFKTYKMSEFTLPVSGKNAEAYGIHLQCILMKVRTPAACVRIAPT